MRGSQRDIRAILATDGVIARREHPELRGAIAWMVRIGELVPVLPGVYAGPAMAVSVETRIRAVGRWDRDSVLTGAAAARLTFWPSIRVPVISCAVRHHRAPQLVVTPSAGGPSRSNSSPNAPDSGSPALP